MTDDAVAAGAPPPVAFATVFDFAALVAGSGVATTAAIFADAAAAAAVTGAVTAGTATGRALTAGVATAGVVTAGVVTAGVVTAGVVMAGVVATGVVIRGTVTAGTVTAGTVTAGTVTTGVVTGGVVTCGTTDVTVLTIESTGPAAYAPPPIPAKASRNSAIARPPTTPRTMTRTYPGPCPGNRVGYPIP
jgi:hypothetical protein